MIHSGKISTSKTYYAFPNAAEGSAMPFIVNTYISYVPKMNFHIFLEDVYKNIVACSNKFNFERFITIYPFENETHKYLYKIDETIKERERMERLGYLMNLISRTEELKKIFREIENKYYLETGMLYERPVESKMPRI